MNTLYYGNNLDILRRYVKDETVDLIYLDPPFNSNAAYNVLFAEHDGSNSSAQIEAFDDTWHWNQEAEATYCEIVEGQGAGRVADASPTRPCAAIELLFASGECAIIPGMSCTAPCSPEDQT